MKYSSTTRLINTVVFALLAIGGGFLGIYFGILVAPYLWNGKGLFDLPKMGWGLAAMLGTFGLTVLLISLYGLIQSVRSIIRDKDDNLVRRSFGAYIAIGYTLALYFFINGAWLYRLTSTNIGYDTFQFVIVVYLVLAVISLIITNIPVIRMYGEGEQLNPIMRILSGSLLAADVALLLVFGLTFIKFSTENSFAHQAVLTRNVGIASLIFLGAAVLGCFSFLGYARADKKGVIRKLNGLLFEGSLILNGGAILAAGIIEHVIQSGKTNKNVSLVASTVQTSNPNYMGFAVMAYIVGGVIILLALGLIYSTLVGSKKKA